MKKFLAVYTGSPDAMSAWSSLPESELKQRQAAGIKAWHEWMQANQASIVESGAPLGRTKSVSRAGVADIRNNMTGYTVVQAQSHEAAARLFAQHPHFMAFPGEAIEIMECLPIPTA